MNVSTDIILKCRTKLVETKEDILNRLVELRRDYSQRETSGDETDLAVANLQEHQFLNHQDRLRNQLLDIETALARIDKGIFGICEETQEPIEQARLLAIPWTRLSIEGAEIREALSKKYAR